MVHTLPSSYEIHDNGGRPFVVDIYPHRVVVIRLDVHHNREEVVWESSYEKIWLGDNLLSLPRYVEKGTGKGNTILVQVHPRTYVFIGSEVYRFSLQEDAIVDYYSPIGNNDVPYPYAIGETHAYFFLGKKRVPLSALDISQDGYEQFYRSLSENQKKGFSVERIATAVY